MGRDFQIGRDRDAWGAIRGFVYQVQHTIQRWLEIAPGSALEPEHGEDIDIVLSALKPGVDTDRVLQQIKYRERDITLNSPEVRAALADFFDHMRANPTLNLRCQFMTNAHAQRERPSHFSKRTPGILVWTKLAQTANALGDDEQESLAAVRKTVDDVPRPQDYPETEWGRFQEFWKASTDGQLFAFIQRVEIRCGEMEPADLTDQIRASLVASGRCADQGTARAAYERLFCFVFETLSRRGPRRLTHEDLATALTTTALTPAQEVLLAQVRLVAETVVNLQPRVDQLEERVASVAVELEVLGGDLRLANALEVLAEAPPQPTLVAPRTAAVAELTKLLAEHSFVAVHGTPGSGKTQLARAVAAPNQIRAWISLTGFDSARAAIYLNLFRARLVGPSESIPDGALVVVDDVPAVQPGGTLAAALTALHRYCTRIGSRTLCVSEHRLLGSISEFAGASVTEFECPILTDDDIAGMVRQRGAPEAYVSPRWVTFFAGITHRHMMLFVAMLAHLAARNWQLDEATLAALLDGEFAQGLAPAASDRLFRSVPDERTRELLHRVRIATGPISDGELAGLAEAPALISEPLVRIAPLDGVWLLRDSTRRRALSPLIRALPPVTLPPETTRHCHGVLADALLRPAGISPFDVQRALLHLTGAARWKQHDMLLASSLASAISNREMAGATYLLAILAGQPLSPAATNDERLSVLGLQFAALRGRGQRAERILKELSAQFDQRALPDPRVASAAGLVVQHVTGLKKVEFASLMIRAIGSDALDGEFPWDGILAMVGMKVDSDEGALLWINTLLGLPRNTRDALLADDPAFGSVVIGICSGVYARAPNILPSTMESIIETLETLRALGRRHSLPLLECAAASTLIIALTDGLKRHDEATLVASSAISIAGQDTRARFLVYSAIAFAHRLKNEPADAVVAYQEAFAGSTLGVEYDAVWSSMLAGETASDRPSVAAVFLEKGVEASRTADVCTPLITARVLLELGLARWLADVAGWHEPLLEGVALVLFDRDDSDEWRSLVARLSHCLGYIVSKVVHGFEVTKTADGSPYRKPWIGVFRVRDSGEVSVYSSEREAGLAAMAANLSHYFGDRVKASRFARHTLDISYDRTDAIPAAALSDIAGYLLAEDLVEDVLAASFENGARHPDDTKGDDLWRPGDRAVALFGFVPVVLRIALRLSQDRNEGLKFLQRALNAFKQWETDQRSGRPWTAVANAIEAASIGKGSVEEDGNAIKSVEGWAASVVHHGCLLLLSIHPRATPLDGATFQALTLPTLWKLLDRDYSSQDLLLAEFIKVYWRNAVANEPYRFTLPADVLSRIEVASNAPSSGQRIAGILEAVWGSLRTPVPTETRDWIAQLKQLPG